MKKKMPMHTKAMDKIEKKFPDMMKGKVPMMPKGGGLTPGQKKLPAALQKAILKKKGK